MSFNSKLNLINQFLFKIFRIKYYFVSRKNLISILILSVTYKTTQCYHAHFMYIQRLPKNDQDETFVFSLSSLSLTDWMTHQNQYRIMHAVIDVTVNPYRNEISLIQKQIKTNTSETKHDQIYLLVSMLVGAQHTVVFW